MRALPHKSRERRPRTFQFLWSNVWCQPSNMFIVLAKNTTMIEYVSFITFSNFRKVIDLDSTVLRLVHKSLHIYPIILIFCSHRKHVGWLIFSSWLKNVNVKGFLHTTQGEVSSYMKANLYTHTHITFTMCICKLWYFGLLFSPLIMPKLCSALQFLINFYIETLRTRLTPPIGATSI